MGKIQPITQEGYQLLHDGVLAFADMEETGVHIDMKYCQHQYDDLQNQIDSLQEDVERSKAGRKWKRAYGRKMNLESPIQLGDILFNHLGIEPKKKTAKGGPSTSAEALEALDGVPFVADLLKMRKMQKARNTFIKGIMKETVDGIMRPSFKLHNVKSFRGSCSDPNGQNFPVRDPEMKRVVRGAIIPSPGNQLMEIDYSGAEVCVAACYHKDPRMLAYILDPTKDMHRDMAAECYKLPTNQVTKTARYCGKNRFVFPQFYGDYWKACAHALWDAVDSMKLETVDGVLMGQHLASQGIMTLKQFESHIRRVEKRFWGQRFKVYNKWKEEHFATYLERGWFDLYTGFRCKGMTSKNECINWPVQGAAFHCLLWALIQLNKWLRGTGLKSRIILQIHDAIVIDLYPPEREEIMLKCEDMMCRELPDEWPWIIVPLKTDVDITEIDGSWDTKQPIKL